MPSILSLKQLRKEFGQVVAVDDLTIEVGRGEFVSLLGPSGCGKTTALRLIAGLEKPSSGNIYINGSLASSAKTVVAPEHRSLGMVFQSYAIWPHMTVFENVAFGLRIKKKSRETIKALVTDALKTVNLTGLGDRLPSQLSGGQQQRVALARALVTEPSVLLLDEPLSNLDAKLRETMRLEIRNLQQKLNITTIFVTHSQEEALATSDRIAVLDKGVLQQIGAPQALYHSPTNQFVADFLGLTNFFKGEVIECDGGNATFRLEETEIRLPVCNPHKLRKGDKPLLLVRPESITLHPRNEIEKYSIKGRIEKVLFTGNIVDYFVRIDGPDACIRVQSLPPIRFVENDLVDLNIRSAEARLVKP